MFVYSWKKTVKVLNPGIMFSVSFLPVQQSNMILQFLIRNSHTHQKDSWTVFFFPFMPCFFLVLIIRDTSDSDTNASWDSVSQT